MKAYLFDFDGTLVDSMPNYGATMLRVLDENNVAYGSDIIKIITPLGYIGTADYFIKMGLNKTRDEIIAIITEYLKEEYANRIPAKSNVIEVLRELKSRGADLNVLTASPHLTCDVCLKANGLWELFDQVWSSDDYALTKSDAALYEKVCERIGCEADEVSFFDDALVPLETAARVGMEVWGVWSDQPEGEWQKIQALCGQTVISYREL